MDKNGKNPLIALAFCIAACIILYYGNLVAVKFTKAYAENIADGGASLLEKAETQPEKPECQVTDIQVFLNDELQMLPVLKKANHLHGNEVFFVPLIPILESAGIDVDIVSPNEIHMITSSGQRCILYVEENILDCYFFGDDSRMNDLEIPTGHSIFHDSRIVAGVVYIPFRQFNGLADFEIFYDQDIKLYTKEYYEENYALFRNVGDEIQRDVYINEKKADTPVYKNRSVRDSQNHGNDFVLLLPVLETLGAQVSFEEPNTIAAQTDALGRFEIKAGVTKDMESGMITEFDDGYDDCYIVDGTVYISFSQILAAVQGSTKVNDTETYIYTFDYERIDIPATLEEAYQYFDENLDADSIEYIKNSTYEQMIDMHFGLGLWIRNNWIYPSRDRIAKEFEQDGYVWADDISSAILSGYRDYLNNEQVEID